MMRFANNLGNVTEYIRQVNDMIRNDQRNHVHLQKEGKMKRKTDETGGVS